MFSSTILKAFFPFLSKCLSVGMKECLDEKVSLPDIDKNVFTILYNFFDGYRTWDVSYQDFEELINLREFLMVEEEELEIYLDQLRNMIIATQLRSLTYQQLRSLCTPAHDIQLLSELQTGIQSKDNTSSSSALMVMDRLPSDILEPLVNTWSSKKK